jgi:hypothetical protein
MERNNAKITERFKDQTREQLEDQVLKLSVKVRIEKAQTSWLDTLADELRDDEEATESNVLYKEYNELTKRLHKELKEDYGIEW